MTDKILDGLSAVKGVMKAFTDPAGLKESRAGAFTEKVGDVVIDTCKAFDTGRWETGIQIATDPWVIVEQYDDESKVREGHAKYIEQAKGGKRDFASIQDSGEFDWSGVWE